MSDEIHDDNETRIPYPSTANPGAGNEDGPVVWPPTVPPSDSSVWKFTSAGQSPPPRVTLRPEEPAGTRTKSLGKNSGQGSRVGPILQGSG